MAEDYGDEWPETFVEWVIFFVLGGAVLLVVVPMGLILYVLICIRDFVEKGASK